MKTLLFCFPHAGGNPLIFKDWQRRMPEWIEIRPIQPPGRGARFTEAPIDDYQRLVARYAADVQAEVKRSRSARYVLFGHSAGARFAFGAALELADRGQPHPLRCILACSSPPARSLQEKRRSALSDEELRQSLQRMGGSPASVLADANLMKLVLPLLRADFRANEGAHVVGNRWLECPVTLIAAEEDREYTPEHVFEWESQTWGAVRKVTLPGGHFSVVHTPDALIQEICTDLAAAAVHDDVLPGQGEPA
jgi:medium-chain acyl-[acyl-carrier-protein] hydrolase